MVSLPLLSSSIISHFSYTNYLFFKCLSKKLEWLLHLLSGNPEDWTSQRVDDIVGKAVTRAKVHLKSELKKILFQNTSAFLVEVKTHYESRNDSVEMKLVKLWMLVVSAMDLFVKVLWLER